MKGFKFDYVEEASKFTLLCARDLVICGFVLYFFVFLPVIFMAATP